MTDTASSPPFLADSRGLDFLNTRWIPLHTEVEGLADGNGLLTWLDVSGLVRPATLEAVSAAANPG